MWKDGRYRWRKKLEEEADDISADVAKELLAAMPSHMAPVFHDLATKEEVDLEQFFGIAIELQDFFDSLDPIITHQVIELPSDKPVAIQFVSCPHLAGRYTFHEGFRDSMRQLLDTPGMYWAMLGDETEGFPPDFYSADGPANQLIPEKFQRAVIARVLKLLADEKRLLCGVGSQHPGQWIERRTGTNPIKNLYLDHKVPFFDGLANVEFKVGQNSYFVGMGHDLPGHSMYNQLHAHARAHHFRWPGVDIIARGDKHTYACGEFTSFKDEFEAGRRNSPYVWEIAVGTAKTGPDPYTIRRWTKGVLEWPFVVLWPDEWRIETTRRYSVARAHMAGLT
jgi:hypothetical protein